MAQIHELNTFSGTLGAGAYLAIDDGTDTGKISSQGLLAATEARIDNIIAGDAPSAAEVTDARYGADGVTYTSLGTAIRTQVSDLKAEINEIDPIVGIIPHSDATDLRDAYIGSQSTTILADASSEDCRIAYFPCDASSKYTVIKKVSNAFRVAWTIDEPAIGVNIYDRVTNTSGTKLEIETGATANYLVVYYCYNESSPLTIFNSIIVRKELEVVDETARADIAETDAHLDAIVVEDINLLENAELYSGYLYPHYSTTKEANSATNCFSLIPVKANVKLYFRHAWGNFSCIRYNDGDYTSLQGSETGFIAGDFTPIKDGVLTFTTDSDSDASSALLTTSKALYDSGKFASEYDLNSKYTDKFENRLITLLDGSNIYDGAQTWSGDWINGGSWTDAQDAFMGMPVKQRTGTWSGIHKAINVEAGKHYHFSAWIKVSDPQAVQVAIKQTASTASVSVENISIEPRCFIADEWKKANVEFDCSASGTIHPLVQAISSTTLSVCGFELAEGYCNDRPIYHCEKDGSGDFATLVSAVFWATMFFDATVFVGDGTWDIISEYGSTYMEGVGSSRRGLYLKNRVRLVFSSRSKVVANYAGSNTQTMLWFAAFNAGAHGFTLENATIECSKIRYCVHDERDEDTDAYTNRYDNCKMFLDNSQNTGSDAHQCIGGGLGLDGHIIINGGEYKSVNTLHLPAVYDVISYHNSAGAGKSRIDISGVYAYDGTVRVNWYGQSTEITEAYVSNCSFTHEPRSFAETAQSTNVNVSLKHWNNEIRS